MTADGDEIVFAVIDDGFDLSHDDLSFTVDRWNAYNSTPNMPSPECHGRHVSGIASAIHDNGVGVSGVDGRATLPGVVATGDQGGQFFVRGGGPAQYLVLLDGMLVYQPFHLLGFYSVSPTEVLSRVDFYAAGFPSRFGTRISSVVDVATRERRGEPGLRAHGSAVLALVRPPSAANAV